MSSVFSGVADSVQRECRYPMFRGAFTGRLITCGVCIECRMAERIRAVYPTLDDMRAAR